MLVQKLLRIDEATIQEIEELSQKLSEKEYTSFSALVRVLIKKGLDSMKKSVINSEQVKKPMIRALEKALEECATQHELHGQPYEGFDNKTEPLPSLGLVEPSDKSKKFANSNPKQVKITIEFQFDETVLVCAPVIDLKDIK